MRHVQEFLGRYSVVRKSLGLTLTIAVSGSLELRTGLAVRVRIRKFLKENIVHKEFCLNEITKDWPGWSDITWWRMKNIHQVTRASKYTQGGLVSFLLLW